MTSTLVRRLWNAGLTEAQAVLGYDLKSGITRNTVVTLASNLAGMALGLASSAWLARGLGPEGLSLFAVLSTVTVIGHTVSDLGLSRGAISQVAATLGSAPDQARHTATAFAQLKLAAALVSGIGMMAFPAQWLAHSTCPRTRAGYCWR